MVGPRAFQPGIRFVVSLLILAQTSMAMGEESYRYLSAQEAAASKRFGVAGHMLSQRLDEYPDDRQARFLRARVFAWSGEYANSLEDYAYLRISEPHNIDYVLGAARVLLWDERPDEAATLLESERVLWPDYEDIWQLELQSLRASARPISQHRAEELTKQAQLQFPDATWIDDYPTRTDNPNQRFVQLGAGFSYESLDNNREDWSETHISTAYHFAAKKVAHASLRKTDRFGKTDTELSVSGHFPLSDRWTASVAATVSAGARVLPESSGSAHLYRELGGGWTVGAGFRHAEFNETYSNVASLSIENYWKAYHFAYKLSRGKAEQADATFAHAFRAGYYYRDDSMVGLSVAGGKESENVGQMNLITTDVRSFAFFGLHRLKSNWSLFWKITLHEQGDLYLRKGAGIELRYIF